MTDLRGRELVELGSSETLAIYTSASAGLREWCHTHECSMHVPRLEFQCMAMLQNGRQKIKLSHYYTSQSLVKVKEKMKKKTKVLMPEKV